MVNNFVTSIVCGCCGAEFETYDWKEDYECKNGNYRCNKCYDTFRPNSFPCMTGSKCKADYVGVNMYGACRQCR